MTSVFVPAEVEIGPEGQGETVAAVSPEILRQGKGALKMDDKTTNAKLLEGQIKIVLKGRNGDEHEYWLIPTMRATSSINRQFNGLGPARDMLAKEDFDAACFVLRTGLAVGSGVSQLSEADAKNLPTLVWDNGLTSDLLIGLIKYVAILSNGGRALPDDVESLEKAEEEARRETSLGN